MTTRRYGVLVQGPLVPGYTLESCRQYRSRYSTVPIVLSTWQGEVAPGSEVARALEELGVVTVLSERPAAAGTQNTNLQLVTARAGLDRLADEGVGVVLKCRTDCRVEADVLALYGAIRERYPVDDAYAQRARLVLAQSYTRRGLPYHASDMVMVGPLDSLRHYFGAPLRSAAETHQAIFQGWRSFSLRDRLFSERGITAHVEQYLCVHYLRAIGWPPRWTIADWHDALARLFYVADDRQLGFRWQRNPGEYGAAGRFDSDYIVNRSLQVHSSLLCGRVSNADWQAIHAGKRPRLDAHRSMLLLGSANLLRFVFDLPRCSLGWLRRLRRGR